MRRPRTSLGELCLTRCGVGLPVGILLLPPTARNQARRSSAVCVGNPTVVGTLSVQDVRTSTEHVTTGHLTEPEGNTGLMSPKLRASTVA
jgi:hypothetical protein